MLVLALVAVMGVAALAAWPAVAKVHGVNGRIVFTRATPDFSDGNTFIANADGSNVQPLFPQFTSGGPRWSPDGTEVAVNSGLGGDCSSFCSGNTAIINPDTKTYRVITPAGPPAVGNFCTIWSPDATRFACDGENDNDPSVNGVYTVRTSDGGGLQRITDAHGGVDISIDYSPDGTQLVFGHFAPFHTCDKTSALWVINLDGTGLHRITPGGFCDDDGSWSPDGTEIAFERSTVLRGMDNFRQGGSLFVVHPDGTGLAKIPLPSGTRAFAGDVSWSPDGTKIAFIYGTLKSPEGIATANADGTDIQQITVSPTFDHETDWGALPASP
jgi:Tol biopolymer transport system component